MLIKPLTTFSLGSHHSDLFTITKKIAITVN